MKKYGILIGLVLVCLLISMPAGSAAKMYAPDLTISKVDLTKEIYGSGGFTINNVGNKNNKQFEVLVYFKKKDGTVFKQYYQSNKSIAPGYSRHYAKVFYGQGAVVGLVRVNPFKRFQEWDYNNNVRYFSMIKTNASNYCVKEGIRYYDMYYDDYEYKERGLYNITNGNYDPVISTPNPIPLWQMDDMDCYVNHLNITADFPYYGSTSGVLQLIKVTGIPYISYNAMFLQVDGYYLLPMLWDSTREIWYKYTTSHVKGVLLQMEECDATVGQFVENMGNITIDFYRMPCTWRWKV